MTITLCGTVVWPQTEAQKIRIAFGGFSPSAPPRIELSRRESNLLERLTSTPQSQQWLTK